MAAVTSPVDGRAQYSLAAVAMADHSLGRWPFAGVEQIFSGRYVVTGSWPTPTTNSLSPSVVAAGQQAPDSKPKTAASGLWPNLPSG